jgi:hypothetical protein
MSAELKKFVELATLGGWDRVAVADVVGTSHPTRCPECKEPVQIYRKGRNGARPHFVHLVANPACSLSHRPRSV